MTTGKEQSSEAVGRKGRSLLVALSGLQLLASVALQLCIARSLGVNSASDMFFVASTVQLFASGLTGVCFETFLQHYTEHLARRRSQADAFYGRAIAFSMVFGGILAAIISIFARPVLHGVAPGLAAEQVSAGVSVMVTMALALIWARPMLINNALLNVHGNYAAPYVFALLAPLVAIPIVLTVGNRRGVLAVAIAVTAGNAVAWLVQQVYVAKRYSIRNFGWRGASALFPMFRSSVPVRVGYQIWSCRDIITTWILSGAGPGMISSYNYAARVSAMVFAVSSTPEMQVFQARAARFWGEGRISELARELRRAMSRSVGLCVVGSILAALSLDGALRIMLGGRVGAGERALITLMFVGLIPVHVVMSAEVAYVQVVVAQRRGKLVMAVSFAYIAFYAALMAVLPRTWLPWSIPGCLFITQAVNLMWYRRCAFWRRAARVGLGGPEGPSA